MTIVDPFGTLGRALWICGGLWAGKSTVSRLLAYRYGITVYRRIADHVHSGLFAADPDPETVWVDTTPEQMATDTIAGFPLRFEWALDDLRALVSGRPILAEG
ncbi:hypothetical protein [Amycolatopsis sp. cmx-4-54]|uniref:hypothetical protein n=1 Tax=Amycolatopsis sp. cmx-4-54 TaxID=2790936 RepID=UPI00397E14C1